MHLLGIVIDKVILFYMKKKPIQSKQFIAVLTRSRLQKISQHLDNHPKLIPRKPYQVRNILLNPNYCGRVINKYGTFNDIVPPIIDVDMFEEAQERRIHKQHNRSNSRNKLKRRIKCPYCQSTLTNLTIKRETLPTLLCLS